MKVGYGNSLVLKTTIILFLLITRYLVFYGQIDTLTYLDFVELKLCDNQWILLQEPVAEDIEESCLGGNSVFYITDTGYFFLDEFSFEKISDSSRLYIAPILFALDRENKSVTLQGYINGGYNDTTAIYILIGQEPEIKTDTVSYFSCGKITVKGKLPTYNMLYFYNTKMFVVSAVERSRFFDIKFYVVESSVIVFVKLNGYATLYHIGKILNNK